MQTTIHIVMRLTSFLVSMCFIFVASRSDADNLLWLGIVNSNWDYTAATIVNSNWDNASATNWHDTDHSCSTNFTAGDNVTFGDKDIPGTFIGRSTPDPTVWTKAFEDDFDTLCARGSFLPTYPRWTGYPTNYHTTDKSGYYDPKQVAVLATTDQFSNAVNVMDVLCTPSTTPGQNVSAAMYPKAFGPPGVAGIRVEQRIRVVNGASGWHIANLLWPDSENWPHDGEIDYYETDANSLIVHIYAHHYGGTWGGDQDIASVPFFNQSQFHVVAVEWIPSQSIKWYVDGTLRATFTNEIEPSTDPMRLVLQIESSGSPTQSCSVQYDWVTVWKLAGSSSRPTSPVIINDTVAPGSVTVSADSINYTFEGAGKISGTAGLTKTGVGTLTIQTTNDYGGTTTVSGGTLQLSNGGTLGSGSTIVSGGALAGDGSGGGSATIQTNGTIAPGNGNAMGTLSFSGNLTLASGSRSVLRVNEALHTNSCLQTSGMLTYGGVLIVTNLSGTLAVGDSFKLFNAGSYAGSFSALSLPPLGTGLAWDIGNLTNNGTLSVAEVLTVDGITNSQMRLNWTYGTLQTATNVTGPFVDVPGILPPYTIQTTGACQFFRIREN